MTEKSLEICFTPAAFDAHADSGAIVVIVDVLRATSSICTAFANGVREIIPVTTVEEAREMKSKGFLVAAERDGYVLDFADFGNSPFNFSAEKIKGRSVVYSTTNGTGIMKRASGSHDVVIGSYLNISAVCRWLEEQDRKVIIVCAGWKNRFSLEDAVCAGAMALKLLDGGRFTTICDSVHAATDLWKAAREDLAGYIDKTAQRSRLRAKGLDDCIGYCHTFDMTDAIPVLREGKLVAL
ncbi:MAG TPA: 2-phosphosulfolactate phosphatase [Bacteroidales bacterium]|jgi:2-phosphosulfolactate phosphatase|nr:2-phosphosulfolactate phosphatase [Bacteroidales bacterium]